MEKKQARSSTHSTECKYLTDMYGNFQPSYFKFDLAAEYTIDIKGYLTPDFISESKFGITDFATNVVKILFDGRRSAGSLINHLVDRSSSVNCNQTHFDSDNITVTSANFDLQDGQALCLQFRVDAGGYLKSKNIITHTTSDAVPYQKVRNTRELCYKYDISPAMHCREKGHCSYYPIQFESRVTRSTDIDVRFIGWFDPVPSGGKSNQASSIESYQLTVNEVTVSTHNIQVNYLSRVYTKKVDFNTKRISLNLTSEKPRLYCLTLEVKDVADNVKQARRFILYDNSSFIETWDDKPFYVTSASIQTNYKWQTHHHDICLNWKDHFLNRFYFDNPLLDPIAPEPHGLVSGIYEQNDGLLPVSGTPNVYGIVQTLVSWTLNDGSPSTEIKVPNFQNQSFCKDLKVKDGQTYTIFIRSIDIANNTFIENKTVHIDRSVPHINNIWLVKDGNKVLLVDTMTDFSKMYLQFEALDPHSGVRQIEWAFGNTTTELTSGSLSVGSMKENSCPQSAESCYCPDVGQCEIFNYTVPLNKLLLINTHVDNHNNNYYFTLKVTNNAYLFNIERVDVFVNNSQPVLGVHFEEIPQTFTLHLEHPPSKDHDLTCNAVTLKCTTGCIFLTPSFIWYYLQSDGLESIWSDSEPVTHTSGQCKEFEVVFTSTLVLQKYTVFNDVTDHTVRFQCGATILNSTTDEVKTQSSVNIRYAVRVAKVSLKIGNSSKASSLNVTDGISEIFKCTTSYSRPLPTIVWYIGRTEKIRVVGTESTLAFIASKADTGKDVYCKAFNIQPENEALFSNKVSLHVKDDPSVDVGLETMDSSDFKTATIVLGIISVICAGTSAGIVIWFKRKTKGTDSKSCTKSHKRYVFLFRF
ncbi:uncharacterized protein LOC132724974 [Ruditapes philippinarum]|uniref:uncharacterized protein LOC132724974 n=1 Tax=Ruditapes philippinarum TaxID=129788 RepID=UPI00295BB885|nr:uncharacterized protein LOC132724974 [Ruditapes philippinarum]